MNDFPIPLYFAAFLIHLELFLFSNLSEHFLHRFFVVKYSQETRLIKDFKKTSITFQVSIESRREAYQESKEKQLQIRKEIEEENFSYKNSVGVQKVKIQKAFHNILIFNVQEHSYDFQNVHQHINQIFNSILLQGISKPRCVTFYVSMYREARND